MASCERCWSRAHSLPEWDHDPSAAYYAAMAEAEARNDVCTHKTEEGARARAGDYWDEAAKRDTRLPAHPVPETRDQ